MKRFLSSFARFTWPRAFFICALLSITGLGAATALAQVWTASKHSPSPPPAALSPAHPELGRVHFEPDFDQAKQRSRAEKKPIFVLFDEVPGCSTVQGYGRDVLSHPLIVDALQTLFVSAFVQNNAPASSAHTAVLNAYEEPRWNNPVGRVVDAQGEPLLPRLDGDYSVAATAAYLVAGLKAAKNAVPPYLELLAAAESAQRKDTTERAQFAMGCFWSGEVAFGGLDGVVSTSPGFGGGRELVTVTFDRRVTSYDALLRYAKTTTAASGTAPVTPEQQASARRAGIPTVLVASVAPAHDDDKYQLRQTAFRFLPMTDAQRTRVNSAVGRGQNPLPWLSPRQQRVLGALQALTPSSTSLEVHPSIHQLWSLEAALGGTTSR